MKQSSRFSGRLDSCVRLLPSLGIGDAHLYLCDEHVVLVYSSDAPALTNDFLGQLESASARNGLRQCGRYWHSTMLGIGAQRVAATLYLSTASATVAASTLGLLATTIEDEWQKLDAIESLSIELGNRYEELNLLYGFEDTLNVENAVELSGLVQAALQNCVDAIDIDGAGVWAPRYGLTERAFSEPSSKFAQLIDNEIYSALIPVLRSSDSAVVINGRAGGADSDEAIDLPFRAVAAPIAQGERRVAGMLTLLRSFSSAPFSNSDRKIAEVLAAEIGKALDQRYDSVTGLMNRETFEKFVSKEMSERGSDSDGAIAHIDLDQFRLINEACGHEAGDRLLKLCAAVLRRTTPPGGRLARLGGDEFIVLLPGMSGAEMRELAKQTQAQLSAQRFIHGERSFEITASTGVREFTRACDLSSAMIEAELACQAAKDLGGARTRIFAQSDEQVLARHSEMRWAADIRGALDDDRVELFGQAICATSDPDGEPSHYEVLLRMYDEEGAMVSPAVFIPAAERYGLITRIDRIVLSQALAVLSDCHQLNLGTRLTVNLSGNSLGDDEFRDFARHALSRAHIARGSISFEITETAAISNIGQAMSFINEMKKIGCTFLLDDFGTGMSSYSYLRQFPVDYVKIDGSFVKNIDQDDFNRSIVESIHHICQAGGKHTIAEFVENDAILAVLQEIGVDFVQGYRIDKPSPLRAKLLGQRPLIRAAS